MGITGTNQTLVCQWLWTQLRATRLVCICYIKYSYQRNTGMG